MSRRGGGAGPAVGGLLLGVAAAAAASTVAAVRWWTSSEVPDEPDLTGSTEQRRLTWQGRERTWLEYRPARLDPRRPVVLVLHGSTQDGAAIRALSSYGMDRLADEHGFAVAYPDGVDGNWAECRRGGDFTAKREGVDDVGFLGAVVDAADGADEAGRAGRSGRPAVVTGFSSGGQMAMRLAIEATDRVRAAVVVAASTATADNSVCAPPPRGVVPMLFVAGTDDPFNPYAGGEVALHGFARRGTVLPAREGAAAWAPEGAATTTSRTGPHERTRWAGAAPVELLSVRGGGHQYFSSGARGPRLLGPSPVGVDVSGLGWDFVEGLS